MVINALQDPKGDCDSGKRTYCFQLAIGLLLIALGVALTLLLCSGSVTHFAKGI